jgi:hypothetical protein
MKKEKHTINGKFVGCFYELDDGAKLYLAHRTRSQVHRLRNAWCFDLSLLERIRKMGIVSIGVIRREGAMRMVWLTHIDDLFNSPDSFAYMSETRQRGLPLSKFRIDPSKSEKVIAKSVKLR